MKEKLGRKKFSEEELEELSKKIDKEIEERKNEKDPERGIGDEIKDMFQAYENEGALIELKLKETGRENNHKNLDQKENPNAI